MKAEKTPLRPHLRNVLREARESAAAPFAPEKLREALIDAARRGLSECIIQPALPTDVRGTAAAKKGVAYLLREGLSANWDDCTAAYVGRIEGGRATVHHLIIFLPERED